MLLLTAERNPRDFGATFSSSAHCPDGEPLDMNFVSILQVGKPWHREAD